MTTSALPIGLYVLFFILLAPVYITVVAWLFGNPRDYRTAAIGVGYMAAILVMLVAGTAAMGVGFWVIAGF